MPTLPTSPIVNLIERAYATVLPGQAPYFAARVTAWRNATTPHAGALAVLGTVGSRIGSGSTPMQVYPKGVRNYQLYPTGISVH